MAPGNSRVKRLHLHRPLHTGTHESHAKQEGQADTTGPRGGVQSLTPRLWGGAEEPGLQPQLDTELAVFGLGACTSSFCLGFCHQ